MALNKFISEWKTFCSQHGITFMPQQGNSNNTFKYTSPKRWTCYAAHILEWVSLCSHFSFLNHLTVWLLCHSFLVLCIWLSSQSLIVIFPRTCVYVCVCQYPDFRYESDYLERNREISALVTAAAASFSWLAFLMFDACACFPQSHLSATLALCLHVSFRIA